MGRKNAEKEVEYEDERTVAAVHRSSLELPSTTIVARGAPVAAPSHKTANRCDIPFKGIEFARAYDWLLC